MTLQELFATDGTWTQGACARNASGVPVSSILDEAVCFCLLGAVDRCYPEEYDERMDALYERVGIVSRWNDAPERTIEDIRRLVAELNL